MLLFLSTSKLNILFTTLASASFSIPFPRPRSAPYLSNLHRGKEHSNKVFGLVFDYLFPAFQPSLFFPSATFGGVFFSIFPIFYSSISHFCQPLTLPTLSFFPRVCPHVVVCFLLFFPFPPILEYALVFSIGC